MELVLKRTFKGPNYTIGQLYVNGVYECDTLEDTDRGLTSSMTVQEIASKKLYGETAIPTGTYKIDMNTVSPKFKDRSWAKFCGDNKIKGQVINSTSTFQQLYHLMLRASVRGESLTIKIE